MDSFTKFKKSITLFFNAYGLKEYYMLLKYHKLSFAKSRKKPMLIAMVDNRRQGKGLTDRFKGIISVYALSKVVGVPFRCVYNHPISLTDFLQPNTYNWVPKADELSDSVGDVRFKLLRKQHTIKRLLRMLPLRKQVRVYANLDYLDEINRKYDKQYQWGELFKELFKPINGLEDEIRIHLDKIGEKGYIACVFRFQSLLGDFEEYNFKPLAAAEQQTLIQKNREALHRLTEHSELPVLVTSDSMRFISEIENLKNVYTIPGKVVHIDCSDNERNEVYMKSFVDFLMLSHASKVYSIGTKVMYQTDFPAYAAKINNVPFERILIE